MQAAVSLSVDSLPTGVHMQREMQAFFYIKKNFNWLSLLSELVSQDAAEGVSDV